MDALVFQTLDAATEIDTLNLGAVAPGSSADTPLRVANTNDTYQAQGVTVTVGGDDEVQLWLSADEDIYTASIDLGDIPPGGVSPIFWLRRVTASTVADGTYGATLTAVQAAWTNPTDTSSSGIIPLDSEE